MGTTHVGKHSRFMTLASSAPYQMTLEHPPIMKACQGSTKLHAASIPTAPATVPPSTKPESASAIIRHSTMVVMHAAHMLTVVLTAALAAALGRVREMEPRLKLYSDIRRKNVPREIRVCDRPGSGNGLQATVAASGKFARHLYSMLIRLWTRPVKFLG